MTDEYTFVTYGCGKCFFPYLERLDKVCNIKFFCDRNSKFWGKHLYGDERICLNPEEIKTLKNPFVIFTLDDVLLISEIQKYFDEMQIPFCHAKEKLSYEKNDHTLDSLKIFWPETIQNSRIHRFIDINLTGTTSCNFHCEYCYVWRRIGFQGENKLSDHGIEELCKGLSVKRTGGVCFINMCARGETLLADNIVEFVKGLLEEGHFVSVVTNATITTKINEILLLPDTLLQRMFFKISFHYKELKRLSLLNLFWNNVEKIKNSKCSFTLEVTPGDGSEQYIEDIKKNCKERMDGALPHISFTRDSTKKGYDLLSNHSIETYRTIWGQFDSKMFDLKSEWYARDMKEYNCYAGSWSYLVNAVNGDIKACYHKEPIGNIFDENMKTFPVNTVGHHCSVSYCFNNHAFLSWGSVPSIDCSDYREMRDRVSDKGEHWVKEPVYSFMMQKLCENNFEYIDKWKDYEKLYYKKRNKAFILFNSPDYSNLGDHAIALAEKRYFTKYFPEYDFIEISCSQYIKENSRINSAINRSDILLITGGGNLGDEYLRLQDVITHIVQTYQENKIIIAPQSMYFTGGEFSSTEMIRIKSIFEKHHKLMITAREPKTYDLYRFLFKESLITIMNPDMAFFLRYSQNELKVRRGALVCLRNDKESLNEIKEEDVVRELNFFYSNINLYSTITTKEVLLDNREYEVYRSLETIASSELVVTDRLHCMIFCILTNTPCIVFDNATGKIFEILKCFPVHELIIQCYMVEEIQNAVQKLISIKPDNSELLNLCDERFKSYSEEIRKFIELRK